MSTKRILSLIQQSGAKDREKSDSLDLAYNFHFSAKGKQQVFVLGKLKKVMFKNHLLTKDSKTSAGSLTSFCLSFLLHLVMFLVFLMTSNLPALISLYSFCLFLIFCNSLCSFFFCIFLTL